MEDFHIKQFELEKNYRSKILNEKNFKMRQKLYQDVYSQIFSMINEYHPEKRTFGGSKERVEFFKNLFKNRVVVDYGCAYGVTTLEIAKYAKFAIGVEIEPSLVSSANEICKNNLNIKFHTVDEYNELYTDNSVDVLFSSEVAEHLHPDDLKNHLKQSYNKLKKGGCYILVTPHRFSGPHDVSKKYLPKGSEALGLHIKEYTYKQSQKVLKESGFYKIRALITSFGVNKMMKILNLTINSFYIDINHKILLEKILPKRFFCNKFIAKLLKIDSIWIIAYK